MKFFVVAFALLVTVALIEASPTSPAKVDRVKNPCLKACTAIYQPICAHDPNDSSFKERTYGSPCALETHNCQHKKNLVKKYNGECKDKSGGVALQL